MQWRKTGFALCVFAIFGMLYSSREPLLKGVGTWLVVESPLRQAELVVALGGSRERQDKAVELLRQGLAQKLLFAGPDFRPRDYDCVGVGRRGIEPPALAYTTYEEAALVRKVIVDQNIRSAIIVTSPYHSRRTHMIFEHVLSGTDTELIFHSAPNSSFSMDRWWEKHIGRKSVLMEYLGLIYYWPQLQLAQLF
jgi:hypothetical protein